MLAVVLVGLVAALVVRYGSHLSNTRSLDIDETYPRPVALGERILVEFDVPTGQCGVVFEMLFRPRGGLWEMTHYGEGDAWTRLEGNEWFSYLPCPISPGSTSLTLPKDITWSTVVACDSEREHCLRVRVDE